MAPIELCVLTKFWQLKNQIYSVLGLKGKIHKSQNQVQWKKELEKKCLALLVPNAKSIISNSVKEATYDKCQIFFLQGPNFNTFYKC